MGLEAALPRTVSRIEQLLLLKEQSRGSTWKRSHTRTEISRLPIEVRVGERDETFQAARILNIGVGGTYLATHHSMSKGEEFSLTLRVPSKDVAVYFSAPARIVHAASDGVGVEFLHLDGKKAEELQHFMREMLRLERLYVTRASVELKSASPKKEDETKSRLHPNVLLRLFTPFAAVGVAVGIAIGSFQMNSPLSASRRIAVQYTVSGDPIVHSSDGIHDVQFRSSDVTALHFSPNSDPMIELKSGHLYRITSDMVRQIPELNGDIDRNLQL